MRKLIRYFNQNRTKILLIVFIIVFLIIFVRVLNNIIKRNLQEENNNISNIQIDKDTSIPDEVIISGEEISEERYVELIKEVKTLPEKIAKILEDKEIIDVEIVSRYMDYIIDINTGDLISGDDTRRIERRNILRFEKKLNTKDFGIVRKCPGCGASINVNNTGKCEYCDTIFNLDDYDYILVSINVN